MGGAGLFTLSVAGSRATSVPASLGLRWKASIAGDGGMVFSPSLELAYAHEFGDTRSQVNTLTMLPGMSFAAAAIAPGRDTLQVKSGMDVAVSSRVSLFAAVSGVFADGSQIYAGQGGIRVLW